jgi:hypothetical protein
MAIPAGFGTITSQLQAIFVADVTGAAILGPSVKNLLRFTIE